ncbi:MAG: hypothetical protein JSV96_10675 [Candidatus Aminicenantes bacterium]|nr:MAG: hypothetical protein JSV96_10675 [Candidatus Aminicenantes bacterium]
MKRKILIFILAFLPLLYLTIAVVKYHVDVPFWDQWNFIPLLGKSFDEGVSLSDLWEEHNEHRLIFPRLIMLVLARVSGYNISCELVANIILAVGIFVIILCHLYKTVKALGYHDALWVVPILSLLVVSLHQGENWVWGWQIQIFMNVFAVVAGFMLLANRIFKWSLFLGAIFFGILATYSFANGLAYWFLGFFALFLASYDNRPKKVPIITIWTGATVLILFSYFYKYQPDFPAGQSLFLFVKNPFDFIQYILKYIGASIVTYEEYALFIGLFGLVFFGWMVWLCMRNHRSDINMMLPYFLLGLYSFSCAILTGIGRIGFGSSHAVSYRYVTFSLLIWVSNFIFLFLLLYEIRTQPKNRTILRIQKFTLIIFIFLLVFLIGRTSYRIGYRVLKSHHKRLLPARSELLFDKNEDMLRQLYIDTENIKNGIKILKKHDLSVFREKGNVP